MSALQLVLDYNSFSFIYGYDKLHASRVYMHDDDSTETLQFHFADRLNVVVFVYTLYYM